MGWGAGACAGATICGTLCTPRVSNVSPKCMKSTLSKNVNILFFGDAPLGSEFDATPHAAR